MRDSIGWGSPKPCCQLLSNAPKRTWPQLVPEVSDECAPLLWIEFVHQSQTAWQMFVQDPCPHSVGNYPLWSVYIRERYLQRDQIVGIPERRMLCAIVLCKRGIGCAIDTQLACRPTGHSDWCFHEVADRKPVARVVLQGTLLPLLATKELVQVLFARAAFLSLQLGVKEVGQSINDRSEERRV